MRELLDILSPAFERIYPAPVFYAVLVLIGFFVGVLTGLFGVGGGFLVVPLLNIVAGVPYSIAVGSSLSFIIGTGAAALPDHIRLGNVEPPAILYISMGSVFGAVFGDNLQGFILNFIAGGDKTAFTRMMHVFFIILLLATAWLVYRSPGGDKPGLKPLQKLRLPPRVDCIRSNVVSVSIPGLAGVGFLVGILSGLLGVGGGVLFMPILLLVVGLGTRQAVGTSLGVVLVASAAGAAKKILSDVPKVSLPVTMALLLGSSLGVQLGLRLSRVMQVEGIRKYFSIVVLGAAALIIVDLILM